MLVSANRKKENVPGKVVKHHKSLVDEFPPCLMIYETSNTYKRMWYSLIKLLQWFCETKLERDRETEAERDRQRLQYVNMSVYRFLSYIKYVLSETSEFYYLFKHNNDYYFVKIFFFDVLLLLLLSH